MQIKANGILMNYDLVGPEEAPTVVLSHSLGSSLAMWDPQINPLKDRYRVLRYDTRGHGRSDAPKGEYTLKQLGEDAIGLLDALGFDAVHWVGLSMGGMIGQCVALEFPDRLKSLALCDTAAVIPSAAHEVWQERIRAASEKGLQSLVQGTLERWFTPEYLRRNPPSVARIRKLFLDTPVEGYVGCSHAILSLNYLDRIIEIHIPTLVLVGEEDPGTPVDASKSMRKRIPDSRLVVLPNAAHLSNIEQSEAFTSVLLGFLEEQSSAPASPE